MSKKALTIEDINKQLLDWRQGDCVVAPINFVYAFNPLLPATEATRTLGASAEERLAEEQVKGLVIVTQTCDIVRTVEVRPYLEAVPLVELEPNQFAFVSKGLMPRYLEIPALRDKRLVGDLDRVMSVEKPVIAEWKRIPGCSDDDERRALSECLARKRARAALPDDFVEIVKPLHKRWNDKHDKETDEGRSLRALREVRVLPSPEWGTKTVNVRFWFLLEPTFSPTATFDQTKIDQQVRTWLSSIKTSGTRFTIDYLVGNYGDLSAAEYIASDRLDFDHLS